MFAKFDPAVLDRSVPEEMKALWRELLTEWQDDEAHERFIGRALDLSLGDYAARCYRQRPEDPVARRRLDQIRTRLLAVAASMAQVMERKKGGAGSRGRRRLFAFAILLLLLFACGLFAAFLTLLK